MSELDKLAGAEFAALERYNDACKNAWQELDEHGTGRYRGIEYEKRVAPLRAEYEEARFARMVGERDVKMLSRGTRRGCFLVSGIVLLFMALPSIRLSLAGSTLDSENAVFVYGAIIIAAGLFYEYWRLGKIPLLGKEEE